MENLDRRPRALRGFAYLLLAVIAGNLCACFCSAATLRYSIIPLADAEGTAYVPHCINNKGDVAGRSSDSGFVYRQGTIHDLGLMGEELHLSAFAAITDRGFIAGMA